MRAFRLHLFSLVAFLIMPCALAAVQVDSGAGRLAAPWLQALGSARARALAATTAAPEGSGALSDNVAGLAQAQGWRLGFGHGLGLEGGFQDHGALIWDQGKYALGLGFDYFSFGSVEGYSLVNGQLASSNAFSPYAYGASLVWAAQWQGLGLGLAAKWLSQSLDGTNSAGALAGDLGLLWSTPQGLSLGLTGQDLGGTLEKGRLPARLKAGLALRQSPGGLPWLLSMDYNQSLAAGDVSANQAAFGTELWPHKILALRLGYTLAERGSLGGAAGLSAGLGARVGIFTVDYAYASLGELGAEQTVALELTW